MSDEIRYLWQQLRLGGIHGAVTRCSKISAAEKAIAARLEDRQQQADVPSEPLWTMPCACYRS